MRRIALALFAIVGVLSAGVFATGAYFSDTISANNYTFTTGTADLKFGFCGPVGGDCSGTSADLDSHTFVTSQLIGPGIVNSGCLVIENKGDYALNLTSEVDIVSWDHPDLGTAFQVSADFGNSSCNPIGAIYSWQGASAAEALPPISLGTLAPGARLYVIQSNRWDSTGNQNHLQESTIKINSSVEGKTD